MCVNFVKVLISYVVTCERGHPLLTMNPFFGEGCGFTKSCYCSRLGVVDSELENLELSLVSVIKELGDLEKSLHLSGPVSSSVQWGAVGLNDLILVKQL